MKIKMSYNIVNLLTWIANLVLVVVAFHFFGRGQYKYTMNFGPNFSTGNPFFIFVNIPQSLAIFPKIAVTTMILKKRFDWANDDGWYMTINLWMVVNALADLFILLATNDCTPDEIKWHLWIIFFGSHLICRVIAIRWSDASRRSS
jgi:hypothetical protein